jgi:hypothetical protein
MDEAKLFLGIPGVEEVSATYVKGSVKHYNVRVRLNDKDAAEKLKAVWPFCNVSVSNNDSNKGNTVADYIVKPEEVKDFHAKLSKVAVKQEEKQMAVILQFKQPITEEMKKKIARSVRASDQLIWGDRRVAIVLQDYRLEAIKAIQERIKNVFEEGEHLDVRVRVV